jgi:hypothetical protein
MPTYARKCINCDHAWDQFCTVAEFERGIVCVNCGSPTETVWKTNGALKTGLFPFETTHLDGKGTKIVVESLHHLRQLERQHGVKATAFSDHQSKWDDPLHQSDLPQSRKGWY